MLDASKVSKVCHRTVSTPCLWVSHFSWHQWRHARWLSSSVGWWVVKIWIKLGSAWNISESLRWDLQEKASHTCGATKKQERNSANLPWLRAQPGLPLISQILFFCLLPLPKRRGLVIVTATRAPWAGSIKSIASKLDNTFWHHNNRMRMASVWGIDTNFASLWEFHSCWWRWLDFNQLHVQTRLTVVEALYWIF